MRPPQVLIILGCGRSGTTILGETLGKHPDLANWYEPYFIWDWHVGVPSNSVRCEADLTDRAQQFVQREFALYARNSGKPWVIDKSPEHCFTIPFVLATFPEAKWIHVVRDGRDVIASLYREWKKREAIANRFDIKGFAAVVQEMLELQPFWRNRLQAILFELKTNLSLNPKAYLNKSKWRGKTGFGARYSGWEREFENLPTYSFNARQWVESEIAIRRHRDLIPPDNLHTVRYENFLRDPQAMVSGMLEFLEVDSAPAERMVTEVWPANSGSWRKQFDGEMLFEIAEIANPLLKELGYVGDDAWWAGAAMTLETQRGDGERSGEAE